MGYTITKAPVLLGIGASAISFTGTSFAQNEKDLKKYDQVISNGFIPIINGHKLNQDDLKMNTLIQEIMCHEKWGHLSLQEDQLNSINEMIKDGLITSEENLYQVTKKGIPFLRNIAMIFDKR